MVMRRFLFALLLSAVLLAPGCARLTPDQKADRFLQRGKALLAKKEYAKALLEFRNAGGQRKNDPELYYQSALAFLGMGDLKNGLMQLQAALQLNPKHIEARLKYAELLAASGRPELEKKAAEHLEFVLTQVPHNADATPSLAFAEIQTGKRDDAVKRLTQALTDVPDDYKSAAVLASVKLAAKDPQGAEAVLTEAVNHAPRSLELAIVLGRFYWVTGKADQAKGSFRRALAIRPDYPPAMLDLAALELATGNANAAGEMYRQLSALKVKEYKPLHALFLIRQKQYRTAAAELQTLYNADTQDRSLRSLLTTALVYDGRSSEAEAILNASLKKNPQDSEALLQRSELFQRTSQFDKAENDLNQVIHMNNSLPAGHLGLAMLYKAKGQPLRQRQELEEAIRLDPSLSLARIQLAELLISTKDPKTALDLMDRAPAPQKQTAEIIAERNWALLAMKNYDEVRKGVTAGLQLNRLPDLLIQDGILKLNQQDYDGGRASLEQALQRDPANLRAVQLLYDSYRAQKRDAEGLAKLQDYARGNPNSPAVDYMVAKQLADNGRRAEARQQLEAAKKADPHFTLADMTLAQMDMADKNLLSARARVSAVLAAEPANVAALLLLGNIEDAAGNADAATVQYRKIVSIDGSNLLALNDLAYHLSSKSDRDSQEEAVKYAEQALQIAPDNPEIKDTMGWAYYRAGMYGRAVKVLESAASSGNVSERKFHLALAYMKTGSSDRGRQILGEIAQKDQAFLNSPSVHSQLTDAIH